MVAEDIENIEKRMTSLDIERDSSETTGKPNSQMSHLVSSSLEEHMARLALDHSPATSDNDSSAAPSSNPNSVTLMLAKVLEDLAAQRKADRERQAIEQSHELPDQERAAERAVRQEYTKLIEKSEEAISLALRQLTLAQEQSSDSANNLEPLCGGNAEPQTPDITPSSPEISASDSDFVFIPTHTTSPTPESPLVISETKVATSARSPSSPPIVVSLFSDKAELFQKHSSRACQTLIYGPDFTDRYNFEQYRYTLPNMSKGVLLRYFPTCVYSYENLKQHYPGYEDGTPKFADFSSILRSLGKISSSLELLSRVQYELVFHRIPYHMWAHAPFHHLLSTEAQETLKGAFSQYPNISWSLTCRYILSSSELRQTLLDELKDLANLQPDPRAPFSHLFLATGLSLYKTELWRLTHNEPTDQEAAEEKKRNDRPLVQKPLTEAQVRRTKKNAYYKKQYREEIEIRKLVTKYRKLRKAN